MSTIFIIVAVVVILIGFNGLYVAAEFSAVAARRTKVSQMAGEGNRFARMLQPILETTAEKDKYLAATQLGITISSLVLGAYGQDAVAQRLVTPMTRLIEDIEPFLNSIGIEATDAVAQAAATSISVTGVLIVFTILQVIMGELFPKSLAIQFPEEVATALVIPMRISLLILGPFIWFFNGSGIFLLRFIPFANKGGSKGHSPEEIEILVTESHESGLLDDRSRQMLRNAFRLRDLSARQVMVHRTRMLSTPKDTPIFDILKTAIDAGYTRVFPFTKSRLMKFLVLSMSKICSGCTRSHATDIDNIIRDVMYIPETMPVLDVWEKLNENRMYLAVVFDEFGGTVGMITFEDLIEEIFGELQDEFDDEMALVSRDKEGRIHLRGDLLVSDVNEYLELGTARGRSRYIKRPHF